MQGGKVDEAESPDYGRCEQEQTQENEGPEAPGQTPASPAEKGHATQPKREKGEERGDQSRGGRIGIEPRSFWPLTVCGVVVLRGGVICGGH